MPIKVYCKYCSKKIVKNKKISQCNHHFCSLCIHYCLTDIVLDLINKRQTLISTST